MALIRFIFAGLLSLCAALPLWADEAPADPGIAGRIHAALPQVMRDGLGKFGPGYLDYAEDLITGYCDIDRIDADGLAAYVGLRRAGLRADAADGLIAADLNGDGAVTTREKGQVMRFLSSGLRARLARLHDAADEDGDGTVSTEEMARYPAAHALARFGQGDADKVLGLMAFDLDGDGWVTVDELRRGHDALGQHMATGSPGAMMLIAG